ncbi:heme/hemin ABC transporter substrate-binding protein [Aureispira anguillae]|uniref:Helical backbone metal receptor n=1 Tax=Aureispira anguillae TaxID=2864201 RepID=A0A915VJS8_9BACT|nr:helical backbone metal receptor [Aureispira anguillae]BDS09318.1 helical backbone metal receptor [Aureispira anguillae]
MKSIINAAIVLAASLFFLLSCTSDADSSSTTVVDTTTAAPKEWRIVSLNGTITELLHTFKLQDKIVGVDVTSTYPESVKSIANLGHTSQLNTEAILELKPNLILIDEKTVGNKALEGLEEAGIDIQVIQIPQTLDGSLKVAQQLGTLLDQTIETEVLAKKIEQNTKKINDLVAKVTEKPKVLFIYARGAQAMMVAGKNTFAEKMIELAGGIPVVQEFESFKPLTAEALLQYQPEAILMFNSGLASLADEAKEQTGKEQLLAIPGVGQTPAGKNQKIITMEGLYLSGFGPRSSDAALELATALHNNELTLLSEVE